MNNKRRNLIIICILIFLVTGGAGIYLLWRVNQEETVAPGDSDAAPPPTDCLMAEKTIDFLSGGEGKLEVVGLDLDETSRIPNLEGKAEIELNTPSKISLRFQDSCKLPHAIKVTANEGYTFVRWEQNGLRLRENSDYLSSDTITIPYGEISGSGATITAIFKNTDDSVGRNYTLTYDARCSAYTGDDIKNDLLSCGCKNSLHELEAGTCFNQIIGAGGDSCPVEVKETEQCQFSGCWEIDGVEVCSDSRTHQITKINKSYSVVALFDNISASASLKYDIHADSKNMGILKVDGTNASSYPVDAGANLQINSIEAVPNIGFEFDTWESTGASLENLDLAKRDISKDRQNRKILLQAKFKEITPDVLQYELRYEAGEGGKLSKNGGVSSALPISVTVNSGENGPSVKAIPNTGYKFVYWIDNATGEKDTSALVTSNPRKDTNITKNISLKAYFEATATTQPSGESETADIPEESKPSVQDTTTPESTETMPEAAALPDKSLYIMTVGTLILCLGMIWQYIPFKKFKLRK